MSKQDESPNHFPYPNPINPTRLSSRLHLSQQTQSAQGFENAFDLFVAFVVGFAESGGESDGIGAVLGNELFDKDDLFREAGRPRFDGRSRDGLSEIHRKEIFPPGVASHTGDHWPGIPDGRISAG